MSTVAAEKVIRIDVVASANAQRTINALATDLKKVEATSASMQRTLTSGFNNMGSMFSKLAGFFGAFGITAGVGALSKAVLDAATSYQVLESRMKLVLGGQERAEVATARIAEIAKLTGRELDGVAKLYEKASRSAQQFGISEEKVSQITLGFAQSIRLSGSSTQEAYASLVQFGQALASGRLQGDEFRSLMENNSVFMYEFAKAAGVSVAALRKMGTEGKLSAQFLFETMAKVGGDGLNMMQRLDKMAKDVPLTFGQSFNSLKTAAITFTGEMAQLFDTKSDDKYGIFGGWIRGITELTNKIKDLDKYARALDMGNLGKLAELANMAGRWFIEKATGSNIPAVQAAGVLGLKIIGQPLPFAEKLAQQVTASKTALEKAEKDLASAQALAEKLRAQGKALPFSASPEGLYQRGQKVRELREDYMRAKSELDSLRYGERVDPNYGKPPPKAEPSAEEIRKAKAAREALINFLEGMEDKVDVNKRLLAGESERKPVLADLERLERLLGEAGQKYNSALAVRGYQLASEYEKLLDQIALKKEQAKLEEKRLDTLDKDIDKVTEQIERDEAAIEALGKRTRASQEFTTQLLKQGKAQAMADIEANVLYVPAGDPMMQRLFALSKAYDEALAKRTELESTQIGVKQEKAQEDIDKRNERRIQNYAESINEELKRGLEKGDFGETFVKNIQDAVKGTVIDIVVNPITTVFSRVLAQIADSFGQMLFKEMAAAVSGGSADPLGMFINILGVGDAFKFGTASNPRQLASGMDYVPYDEYPAMLHRGERVMTAAENSRYSGGSAPPIVIHSNPVINIDSRTDSASVYAIAYEATQRGNKALVEELRAQGALA